MSPPPTRNRAEIASLAARLLGAERVQLAPVATPGMETQAFRVSDGHRTGCLRVGADRRGFGKDRWARATFGAVLPVPEVWDVGELEDGSGYCLTSWATGRTLQDLTAEEVTQLTPLVYDAWTRLQTAAISTTTGFGDLDPDTLTAPYASHHDRLRADLDAALTWPESWVDPRHDQIATLLAAYGSLIDACPNQRSFVHGDWGSNNILAADGRLTAILDWETVGVGDPLQDIAGRFWEFWPPVAICVRSMAADAERRLGQLPNFSERRLCYDLRTGLGEITGCLADNDLDFAETSLARCLDLLAAGPVSSSNR